MAFNNTIVARAAAAIWGLKLGFATTQYVLNQANVPGVTLASIINAAFNDSYVNTSNSVVADAVVANLGLTGTAATDGKAYLLSQLTGVATGSRGAVIASVVDLFSTLGSDPTYGAAASAFNAKVAAAVVYSSTAGTQDSILGNLNSATSFELGLGRDNITGTAGNDTFTAYIVDNSNTLQSADFVDGGAGTDTLFADMGSSANFAVTPITRNVENFAVRGEARQNDTGDNNVAGTGIVNIDAERMVGVNRYESNNSRADVLIEDVRILPSQITKDITVAFVQSDPGNVDFALYFDQPSLRANSTSSSSLVLQLIDLKAAGAAATAATPLLDSPYDGISFTVNGTLVFLSDPAIGNATTYAQLLSAIQAQLAIKAPTVTAALGATFTVNDSQTLQPVTGTSIVLSATNATFGIGNWIASAGVPANSNLFTNQLAGTSATNDLVVSTVLLDDVGRGSNGGDLIIGGLSVGATSTSRGVDKFDITVERTSRLQNIDSTNNYLKEVVLKNGTTSGNFSAIGNVSASDIGLAPSESVVTTRLSPFGNAGSASNLLPGQGNNADGYGFNDVRLIDATAMRGTVTYDAAITAASLGKYVLQRDTQSSPAGDNTSSAGQTVQVADFIYTGGTNADRILVQIDANVISSRSTILSGREDVTFSLSGGAGNDVLWVSIDQLNGGLQNWYTNQKLNANVRIDGGDGNDTIYKPGAGDAIISGGTGADTIYADNSGSQTIAQNSETDAGRVYAAAAAAELASGIAATLAAAATDATVLGNYAAALTTLDLATPVGFNDPTTPANPNPALPTKANLETAIDAARTAGAITVDQQLALYNAYATRAAGSTITPANTVGGAATISAAAAPANATLTPAEFAAGNALLDTYLSAARSAAANATAADASIAFNNAVLNPTQQAVVAAQAAVSQAFTGTQTILTGLNAVNSALVVGATQVQVAAALNTAVDNGSLSLANANALFAAAGAFPIVAAAVPNIQLVIVPLINGATNANTTANATLTTALGTDAAAVRVAAADAGAIPAGNNGITNNDAIGSTDTALGLTAANAVVTAQNNILTPLTAVQSGLAALKSALAVGISDLDFQILTTNAVFNNVITGGQKTALDAIATGAAGVLTAAEKANQVDVNISAIQVTNNAAVAAQTANVATVQAIAAAAAFANTQAAAATLANTLPDGTQNAVVAAATPSNGVWVLNTANQVAASNTAGSLYQLAINDERNLFDLRSDANNTYNLYATRLTVDFKGLTSTVTVPSTNFRTSDLQINQAIKLAINSDAVLSKLIVATDGPANSLVITSLIDGVMSEANLAITLVIPATNALTPSDVTSAAAVYGVTATEAAVLAAMTTAKAAFDTKGDYVDRLAETGALGGNTNITGANSTTTSDNTITPGSDNDVVVLGTTSSNEELLSSNDTVVFGAAFGNDVIVNFRAGAAATGGDKLSLGALGGTTLTTAFDVNRSVSVVTEVAGTNGTAALVAAAFVDSAAGQTHVYIAVDTTTNIGKVYQVVDAAGVGTGSVTATLAGTIDLADTAWSTLTTDNFGA